METVLGFERRQRSYPVTENSQVASTRRAAADLSLGLGFDDIAAGQVALVVTEAATNILKHAGHGEILLRGVHRGGVDGIEVIALDSGPGMRDLSLKMADGTSTAGSYGVGLGAMQRLAGEFDIYSAPDKGTVVVMRIWKSAPPPLGALQAGVVCLPLAGETLCGDSWCVASAPTQATLMVADGLGPGGAAAAASEAAARVVEQDPCLPPAAMLDDMHAMLRATRGAAVAVAHIDTHTEELSFAGVGNIAAHVFSGAERKQMVSHNGIVGGTMRKVQQFTMPWTDGALLIMHSDGLGSRWNLEAYPGLAARHPAIIAAVLYRDFSRGRDDVAVLVARDQHHLPQ